MHIYISTKCVNVSNSEFQSSWIQDNNRHQSVVSTTITNFVFPSSWHKISLEDLWLPYTIGLYPYLVWTINVNSSFFIEYLQNPGCTEEIRPIVQQDVSAIKPITIKESWKHSSTTLIPSCLTSSNPHWHT